MAQREILILRPAVTSGMNFRNEYEHFIAEA
jgi:hypothetical protein